LYVIFFKYVFIFKDNENNEIEGRALIYD